eukprot:scaffold6389_cov75-Phaeocystis_antarctica.AAC.2
MSGSRLPFSWFRYMKSDCSAGSCSIGISPTRPQLSICSSRSTSLHTTASPSVAAHVPFSFTPSSLSASREQPGPSNPGTTRSATAGATNVTSCSLLHHRRRQLTSVRQHDAPREALCIGEAMNLHAHDRPQPVELLQHVLAEAVEAAHRIELRQDQVPIAARYDDL